MEIDTYIVIGTMFNSLIAVVAIWYASKQSDKSFDMLKLNMDMSFEIISLKAELELTKMKSKDKK